MLRVLNDVWELHDGRLSTEQYGLPLRWYQTRDSRRADVVASGDRAAGFAANVASLDRFAFLVLR